MNDKATIIGAQALTLIALILAVLLGSGCQRGLLGRTADTEQAIVELTAELIIVQQQVAELEKRLDAASYKSSRTRARGRRPCIICLTKSMKSSTL